MADYKKELDAHKVNNKIFECPSSVSSKSHHLLCLLYFLEAGLSAGL